MELFKTRLFTMLQPISPWYRLFKVLATAQFMVTLLLPVFLKDLQTVSWLLSFALFAFFVSSYALLRMAAHFQGERTGIRGWLAKTWENLVLIVWVILLLLMAIGVIKLIIFRMLNN